jgi:TatD DNase family protein
MLIDSHAHLTGRDVLPHVDEYLAAAKAGDVEAIINICTDLPSLEEGIKLHTRAGWIYNAGATTPHDVEKEGEANFSRFAMAARGGDLVAVGETGLDYHYDHSDRSIQKQFLRRYLHLALETSLPVIIHCREAFADLFEILDKDYSTQGKVAPGVLHCFTGTAKEAEEVIKRGWYLSLSGIVTFKKSIELQEIAKMVPLNQLLIETDTPYLAPMPHRGKMNQPAYVVHTASFIAHLRNSDPSDIIQSTNTNAKNLFGIG